MKRIAILLLLPGLIGLAGCKDASPAAAIDDLLSSEPDTCKLTLTNLLPGNRYTDLTASEKVVLRDPGEGNWRLEVYDLFSCEMKAAYQLPPNESPDYPYYLADLTYNNSQRNVGIRGYRQIFLIDLENQETSNPISPEFLENNRLTDTESGALQHLEVWENYLVGATADWGTFVLRLDSLPPVAILPVAELTEDQRHHSLFLIETGNGKYQAILPHYQLESGLFSVNPLFPEPIGLDPAETVYAGGPYARVREPNGTYIGVDIRTGELLPVIEEKVPN